MKLIDLSPAWLTPDVFIFRNPTGRDYWLTCKRVPMSRGDQYRLIQSSRWINEKVVITEPDSAWHFDGNDFAILTVRPSLDASASGNWHGFITNGQII